MNIITEPAYDCSEMQTIIRLPQTRDEEQLAHISHTAIEHISSYLHFTDTLLQEFSDFPELVDFIITCKQEDEIYYIKCFPYVSTNSSDDVQGYICYGRYLRDLPPIRKIILFRIDQKWDEFSFPIFTEDIYTKAFKRYVQLLSGTLIDRSFSSIYLEQKELGNISDFIRDSLIEPAVLDGLYLFSRNYWGNAFFLDQKGDIMVYSKLEKALVPLERDLITWTEKRLHTFFDPQSEA
jgi:hypothetical protein